MARRIAFSRRLCVTYQWRGRPGGSGRFSTGAQGSSSRTGRFAVDWMGRGFGFRAAAGTGILLSRSGRSPGSTTTPAIPSNTASSVLPGTDIPRLGMQVKPAGQKGNWRPVTAGSQGAWETARIRTEASGGPAVIRGGAGVRWGHGDLDQP